jgi:hypothetical protein
MKNFRWVFNLTLAITFLSSAYELLGGPVKIRGQYIWKIMAHSAVPENSKTNTFTVWLGTNSFRIHSTDYFSDLPCEAAYNGVNISSLIRGREVNRPTNIVELAAIDAGNRPAHIAQILQIIWLAYASAIPARPSEDVLRDLPYLKVWEKYPVITYKSNVEVTRQNRVFVDKAKLFCSATSKVQGGSETLAPPFDKGFLCALYNVVRWKEFSGTQYPEKSVYQVLFAADQTHANQAKSAEDSRIVRSCELTVMSVEKCDEPLEPLKCQNAITWLDDYRLLGKYSTTQKMTNGVWPKLEDYNLPKGFDELKRLEMSRRERLELNALPEESSYFKYARPIFWVGFLISTALVLVYFKRF